MIGPSPEQKWKSLSIALISILSVSVFTSVIFMYQNNMQQQVLMERIDSQFLLHDEQEDAYAPFIGFDSQPVNLPSVIPAAYGAGTLTNVRVSNTNNFFGSTSWYAISFRTATTATIAKVEMTFPTGFDISQVRRIDNVGIPDGTMSASGQTAIYTVTAPGAVPNNTLVKILLERIVNPNSAALNQVAVATYDGSNAVVDGPTNSATFVLVAVDSDMIADGITLTSPTLVTPVTDGSLIVNNGGIIIGGTSQVGVWNSKIPLSNIISTPDTIGDVGTSTSITIGTDGLPIVSYFDDTNDDLKVLHCGNVTCTAGNTITSADTGGQVGAMSSIAIGTDGLPIVSYFDDTNDDLKVLHCGNVTCTAGNNAVTVDSTGNVGWFSSISVGIDGLPIVSYQDRTNADLKLLHCGNVTCTSGNVFNSVDAGSGFFNLYSSLAMGLDGLPIISYKVSNPGVIGDLTLNTFDLKTFHCSNVTCSSGIVQTIFSVECFPFDGCYSAEHRNSITISNNGMPLIVYEITRQEVSCLAETCQVTGTSHDLYMSECRKSSCEDDVDTNVVLTSTQGFSIGSSSSIAIGTVGHPIVGYWDNASDELVFLYCTSELRTTEDFDGALLDAYFVPCGDKWTTVLDSAGLVGGSASIAVGSDGLPIISYFDATNRDLKIVHVGSASGVANWTRR